MFELHEFSNYRILGFSTLFLMKTTFVVKKTDKLYSITCLSVKIHLLIIDNISPNVDPFPYCEFSNVRMYKQVTWTYFSFHAPSHLFNALERVATKCISKFAGFSRRIRPFIGMLFGRTDVNQDSKV